MLLLSFTGRNVPDDPSKGWVVQDAAPARRSGTVTGGAQPQV
jgi:hypothetical protein